MKRFASTPFACLVAAVPAALLALSPVASAEETASLTVTFTGIEKPQGALRLGVYDAATYENGRALTGANVAVDAETETVTLEGLAPGEYGLKVFHDEDGNGEMNSNMFGIPTEPFAFSNNAKGRFGPAAWDDAKFTVTAGENAHAIAFK